AVPLPSTKGKRHGNGRQENQGDDARRLGEHRSGGAAEREQEPGRLAQAVLSQARFQVSAVRSIRARDRQLGRPLRVRAARADQDRRTHAVAGPHPIAPGAQKVDFVADETYEVTPLAQGFADVLNKVASAGYAPWAVNSTQSIFGKAFAPFGLEEA